MKNHLAHIAADLLVTCSRAATSIAAICAVTAVVAGSVATTAQAAPRVPPVEVLLLEGSQAGAEELLANLSDAKVAATLEPRLEKLGITPLRLTITEAVPPDYEVVELVIDDAINTGLVQGVIVPVGMGIGGGQTGSIWVSGIGVGDASDFNSFHFGTQYATQALALQAAHGFSTGRGVTVAVLDTGVFAQGPLRPYLVGRGFDCVDGLGALAAPPIDTPDGVNSDPQEDGLVDECVGHGNFVGSLIALVAPEARQYHIRCIDSDGRTDSYLVAQAIEAAIDAKVQVMNLSLMIEDPEIAGVEGWLEIARANGITVVASAGNRGSELAVYPAAYSNVISVGASDANGGFASNLSNRHPTVDICAPAETPSTPAGISPSDDKALIGIALPAPPYYRATSGTSFAAAWVSGAAALYRSSRPDWPNAETPIAEIGLKISTAISVTATPFVGLPKQYVGRVGAGVVECGTLVADTDRSLVPTAPFDITPSRPGTPAAIDASDLAAMLGDWGPVPTGRISYADLDHDGIVGAGDLAMLLSQWTP